ncbi:type IV toxin-antitoxin system AbiEi family antitoxin domain-containing protein [Nocardia arthritidis]|uniref:AbiEi antitoxin N-terminal domain-containing protein n=1 Tax=Nocardia arthritidis TaxID=228602 RepID=A0A6G9YRM3_9NOCA|nr:type IV toxin-antitoxin system AbiEi family antitoxin domain-containing protein [Nocardia arthritidis]QIS15811.1 hypothetical protein F5544_39970 [Nocardia arthritidis]
MAEGDFVSLEAAATTLGVSVRQVRRLADAGSLTRVARGLLERDSMDRYLMSQRRGRTRAWAEYTAWGAIALLSGEEAGWLGPTQTSRVRRTLRELTDPTELVARVRDRARIRLFTAHRAALTRLGTTILQPNLGALGIVDIEDGHLDGYIATQELDNTIRTFGLRENASSNVTLRVTSFDIDQVDTLISAGVVAALDSATSLDPRIRGVGQRALSEILENYR